MLIKIPDERAAQLKALADKEGMTVTDLIGRFINREIKAGRLPDETPGFRFNAKGQQVHVEIEGVKAPPMSCNAARSLAKQLEYMASGKSKHRVTLDMDVPSLPEVGRVGTGVYLEFHGTGARGRRVIAPGVALDIARQLRRAAADADPNNAKTVEQLLGDLELGADESDETSEVIEHLDELKSDA